MGNLFAGKDRVNLAVPAPYKILSKTLTINKLNPSMLAGISLWALAIYLGFSPLSNWVMEQLNRWMNFAERLYTSAEEFERTKSARESQNAFYASLLSIVPFLLVGGLCNWGVEISLGKSWAISIGVLACMSCAVYELGRQDGRSRE